MEQPSGNSNRVAGLLKSVVEYLSSRLPERRVFRNNWGTVLIFRENSELENMLKSGVEEKEITEEEKADFQCNLAKISNHKVVEGAIIIWVQIP